MTIEARDAIQMVQSRQPARADRQPGSVEFYLLLVVVAVGLAIGWIHRNSGDLTAETGVGYWLGITGGIMMLTLLVYPLRKRLKSLRLVGNIPGWFRIHMMLGVLGPALAILHSNFRLGATNSRAAMLTMLFVAGSGFVGRFLYAHIHRGLYGQRQNSHARLDELAQLRTRICQNGTGNEGTLRGSTINSLADYQESRLGGAQTWSGSLLRTLTGPISRARLRRRLMAELLVDLRTSPAGQRHRKEAELRAALDGFFKSLGRAEAFVFYERSFAAWHLLHLPLFAIMILATIAHVIAVHLY